MGASILKGAMKLIKDNPGRAFNVGISAPFAVMDYQDAKDNGSSTIGAAASAGFDMVLGMALSLPQYIGYMVATEAPAAALEGYSAYSAASRQLGRDQRNLAFQSMAFSDTEQTYTMRQAGMAQAQKSKYNMQAAMLGHEAKYFFK